MHARLALLGTLLLVGTASAEPADTRRVAVLELKFTPDLTSTDRDRARAALSLAVEQSGLRSIDQGKILTAENAYPDLFTCQSESRCLAEIGRVLNADLILAGNVSREGEGIVVALALFDVKAGAFGAEGQRAAPRAAKTGLEDATADLVSELVRTDEKRPRGVLVVRTEPPGAKVRVDQRDVGTSDLELPVFAGLHTVELNEGAVKQTVEVGANQHTELRHSFTAPLPPERAPHYWSTLRLSGVVVGAAGWVMLGVGLGLNADDGGCTNDPHCVYRWDNGSVEYPLIAIGATAIAASIVLFAIKNPSPQKRAAIAPVIRF